MIIAFTFILVCICAVLLLPPSLQNRIGLNLPDNLRSKPFWQAGLFLSLLVMFLALRLLPFAILLIPVAAGVMLNSYYQKRRWKSDNLDVDVKSSQPKSSTTKSDTQMSYAEALAVLGLNDNATRADVDQSYKKLISQLHPDAGGTDYLAAKINQARDRLYDHLQG